MFDAGFDERWKRHAAPQASLGGVWAKLGWTPQAFQGARVLDAGCGCGRYTKLALECGAAEVVAMDLSPAALAACKANAPAAVVVEADLLDVPASLGEFDLVFALGTLHHTESTAAAFASVAKRVRPGGRLAVWVYDCPVPDRRHLLRLDMLHEITRACPPDVLHGICERYAVKLRDLDQGKWGPLEQVLRVSTSDDDDECISDTFDWHTPRYRWWHTQPELRRWFAAAGFESVLDNPFPVSATGTRE